MTEFQAILRQNVDGRQSWGLPRSPCGSFLSIKPTLSFIDVSSDALWKFRAICYRDVVRNPQTPPPPPPPPPPPRRQSRSVPLSSPPLEISRPPQSSDVLVFYRHWRRHWRRRRIGSGGVTSSVVVALLLLLLLLCSAGKRVEHTNRPSFVKKSSTAAPKH